MHFTGQSVFQQPNSWQERWIWSLKLKISFTFLPSLTFLEYLLILEGLIGLSWVYNSHLFSLFSSFIYGVWITSEKWINSVSQIARYLSIDKVCNTGWKWGFIYSAGLSYIFFQQSFTCSKSRVKTLEKGRNMFKGNNKETRATSMTSFCHWLSW